VVDTDSGLVNGVNRCPKCGSTEIQLRVGTGQLICLFCRHQWSAANFEQATNLTAPLDTLAGTTVASGASDIVTGAADVVTLKCQGCGAEVVIDSAHTAHARCHWCRHILGLGHQIPNGAVPDAVLPFALTHDDAVARISAFVAARRFFANSRFKAEFAPENVVGVYLPYMVVDARAQAGLAGIGEVTTRTYTRGSGDNRHTVYDADVYQVTRQLDYTVDDLTIESSAERANLNTRVNTNNIINTILPFDTKAAVQWNPSYLVGFTSEKRDTNVADLTPVVEDQLLSIARAQVLPTLSRFNRGVRWEREQLDVAGTRWVAMYLPVWLYSYFQPTARGGQGLLHYVAVNARTGETMGSVPLAIGRLAAMAVLIGVIAEILAILILVVM
jgi:Zn finger protein HypA/HybF involved in hydrogenase expression